MTLGKLARDNGAGHELDLMKQHQGQNDIADIRSGKNCVRHECTAGKGFSSSRKT